MRPYKMSVMGSLVRKHIVTLLAEGNWGEIDPLWFEELNTDDKQALAALGDGNDCDYMVEETPAFQRNELHKLLDQAVVNALNELKKKAVD